MYRHNIRLLSIFNFLTGFSLFAPLAIIYFSRVAGSFALGTSIFGITMLASAICEVPTGVLSDRVGRKYTIVYGSWARVLAFVLYAVGLSYWWLVAGAVCEGLSRAFYSGNNDALLHDTLADEGKEMEYSEYLGKTSSTEQLALGLSAVLGGLIADFSFTYLMWLSVISQVFLVVVSYRFHEPKARSKGEANIYAHIKTAFRLFLTNKKLRLLSISSMVGFAFGESSYQFRAAFIGSIWPLWAIGFSSILTNVEATVSYWFSGPLIKKFSEVKLLIAGSAYGKIINFIAYIFPTVFSPLIITTTALFYGVNEVAKNKLMQEEFTAHQRATMSSLNSLFGSVLYAVVFLLLGLFADALGPAQALVVLTVLSLPTTYLYWLLFRNERTMKA